MSDPCGRNLPFVCRVAKRPSAVPRNLTFIGGPVYEIRGLAVKLTSDCSRPERTGTPDPEETVAAGTSTVPFAANADVRSRAGLTRRCASPSPADPAPRGAGPLLELRLPAMMVTAAEVREGD